MKRNQKLVFLGVGKLALSVADAAHGSGIEPLYGTTRSAERRCELLSHRIEPILFGEWLAAGESASELLDGANVLVSIPPIESSPGQEEMLSRLCRKARKVIYISSTTVYGLKSGQINEDT
ncbi:MAG: hypothetical protein SFV17_23050, partial [Candidatus Obscuribacter sp.]|nr:hypothetical protein [Candidatus Obscuribacter sp.]